MKQSKKSLKEVMKKVKKVELAEQDRITDLQPYVDKVLKAFGYPEALVTNESCVCDFLDIFDKDVRMKQVQKAKNTLKVDIYPGDYVWEVAKRVRDK